MNDFVQPSNEHGYILGRVGIALGLWLVEFLVGNAEDDREVGAGVDRVLESSPGPSSSAAPPPRISSPASKEDEPATRFRFWIGAAEISPALLSATSCTCFRKPRFFFFMVAMRGEDG